MATTIDVNHTCPTAIGSGIPSLPSLFPNRSVPVCRLVPPCIFYAGDDAQRHVLFVLRPVEMWTRDADGVLTNGAN